MNASRTSTRVFKSVCLIAEKQKESPDIICPQFNMFCSSIKYQIFTVSSIAV